MRRLWGALALCLLLTGCWDRHETNELLIVQAIGADWQDGQVALTAEVINTRAVAFPGSASGSPREPETILITGHGATPAQALADLDAVSARHVFWPSADVLIVGEDEARHGIRPLLDTFVRTPKLSFTTRVLITRGTARTLLAQRQSGAEISVGRQLRLLTESHHRDQSTGWAPHVYDLIRWDAESDRAALVFGLQPTPPSVPTGPGYLSYYSAVLYRDQQVGTLTRDQVRLSLWLTGRFVRGLFGLPCPGRPDVKGAFHVLSAKVRTRPVIEDGRLTAMDVRLSGRASLDQSPCTGASLAQLQQAAAAEIQRQAQQTITSVQQGGYDVFGWGEEVFRRAPALWRQRYVADWPAAFSRLPVRLEVSINLQHTGESLK